VASFLAGSLAKQMAQAFKGVLLTGTLQQQVNNGLNAYGDAVSSNAITYNFTGMREDFDASYRVRAGIPETDVKIMVLIASCKPVLPPPQPEEAQLFKVSINGLWYQVRKVLSIDPASATLNLQCYSIPAP
jgi:hypothetical protein